MNECQNLKIDVHRCIPPTWQSLSFFCTENTSKPVELGSLQNNIFSGKTQGVFYFCFTIMQICLWCAKMLNSKGVWMLLQGISSVLVQTNEKKKNTRRVWRAMLARSQTWCWSSCVPTFSVHYDETNTNRQSLEVVHWNIHAWVISSSYARCDPTPVRTVDKADTHCDGQTYAAAESRPAFPTPLINRDGR